jgi:hypothetical protein
MTGRPILVIVAALDTSPLSKPCSCPPDLDIDERPSAVRFQGDARQGQTVRAELPLCRHTSPSRRAGGSVIYKVS